MILSDISIKRPVMTTMFIFAFVVIGLFSLTKLGIDIFPEIEFPFVTIVTIYPGAGPEEVETLITKPIEEEVASISGLKNIISFAQEGMSLILLEFELGRDVDLAGIDVKDKVDAIRSDLPQDAFDSEIQKFDIGAMPIINLAVSSPRPLNQLFLLSDEIIKKQLNRIQGLASVEVVGGKEREIVVAVDRRKLQARGLSILQVVQAFKMENINLPSGRITAGRKEYSIRVKGEFESIEEINNLYLPLDRDEEAVRLRDIAKVEDIFAEQRELARMNGVSSVGLSLIKRSDANAVQVGRKVKQELKKLEQQLPADIEILIARDKTDFIQDSVNDVRDNLIIGILLTAFVLFLFLHSWKGTIIAAVAMPVSIVSTFTLLLFADFTINMMSLMALAISVGILVTNSIVVLENIERYRKMGKSAQEAASTGTSEIALAVVAATLTNVVVFTPIAFMSGITGMFFKQFGLTVAFATVFSLLVSFTLTPMMASLKLNRFVYALAAFITIILVFFSLGPVVLMVIVAVMLLIGVLTWTGVLRRFFSGWDKLYGDLAISYKSGLQFFLKHRILLLFIVTILFISSLMVGAAFIGSEFMPKSDEGNFSVSVEMPAGATMEETDKVLRRIEKEVAQIDEVKSIYSQVGTNEAGEFTVSQGVHLGMVVIELKDLSQRRRSTFEIINELRPRLIDIPAARIILRPGSMIGGGEADLTIEVIGSDMKILSALANQVIDVARRIRGVVEPRSSWRTGKPEIKITPRREMLADQNLSVANLAMTMRTMIEGQKVSKYREGSREFDIRVKLREEDLQKIEEVPDFSVMTKDGSQKVSNIANIDFTEGPSQIQRKNKQRMITISAELSGTTLGQAQTLIQTGIDSMEVPEGYNIRFGGQSEMMAESFGDLLRALVLAIVLTYMLLAAIMESYIHPFTIMMTLPLALIGILYILFLTGNSISIMSLMAIIMLVGIVVNNGILLIDYTQNLRREKGYTLIEAILEAAPTRLRPIIMINLATALGMTPLALGLGAGAEMRAPMAISSIGGLITSTLFTLFLIPIIYYTFENWKEKLGRRKSV